MLSIKLIYDTFYCIVIATRCGAAQSSQRTRPNCMHTKAQTQHTHTSMHEASLFGVPLKRHTCHCTGDEANGIPPPAIFANSIDFIMHTEWLEIGIIFYLSHRQPQPLIAGEKSNTIWCAIDMKNTRTTARLRIQPLACRRRWLFGPLNLSQFSFSPRAAVWQREEKARLFFVRIKRTAL